MKLGLQVLEARAPFFGIFKQLIATGLLLTLARSLSRRILRPGKVHLSSGARRATKLARARKTMSALISTV